MRGPRHRQNTLCVFEVILITVKGKLTLDMISGSSRAVSQWTSSLYHKAVYYSVKFQTVIKALVYKTYEIIDSVHSDLRKQLGLYYASVLHCNCNDRIFNHKLIALSFVTAAGQTVCSCIFSISDYNTTTFFTNNQAIFVINSHNFKISFMLSIRIFLR